MIERLSSRHVVLLGIGHTNAHVLRMWRMNPIRDTDLTCISDFGIATYSGMMPAVLAGQVPREQMEIDLVRLTAAAGARLITDQVEGIDHDQRIIRFADRPPIPFDVLSIGIGSVATRKGLVAESDSLIEVKPMQTFLDRLAAGINRSSASKLRVCVVGGGVAGVEISLCLPAFVQRTTDRPFAISLMTSSDKILPGVNDRARQRVVRELRHREVEVLTSSRVSRINQAKVQLDDGKSFDADVVIWATGATAPPLLDHLNLKLDDRGFIETDSTLQSTAVPAVFAVGDTGTIVDEALPKAGVYAVRQGPVLWKNIQLTLAGETLQRYRPQRNFLKLINLGDGRAVAVWRNLAVTGSLMMRWKDRIDQSFMEKFRATPMQMGDEPMQCRGCGCKLETESLRTGLESIDAPPSEDAAVIFEEEYCQVASTDFFSAPTNDAYLAGRIAAIHSASDIIASGARPTHALANVVLPEGDAASKRRALADLMAGARREFASMGAKIVGGHTIVGPRMETGFTVIGRTLGDQPIGKSDLRTGDRLFLTKPLGIGVLLAAQMRGECESDWYQSLLEAMLSPQLVYAEIAHRIGVVAGTDVTGFGLAGHLLEMLMPNGFAAEVHLRNLVALPGAVGIVRIRTREFSSAQQSPRGKGNECYRFGPTAS